MLLDFQRTVQQLRKCWQNEKTKQKKELAGFTTYTKGTGGGPPIKTPDPNPHLETALAGIEHFVEDALDCDVLTQSVGTEEPVSDPGAVASSFDAGEGTELERSVSTVTNAEHSYADTVACSTPESNVPCSSTASLTFNLPAAATKSGNVKDAAVEKEMRKRLERLQGMAVQEDELHSLRMKEQQYRTEIARLEYEQIEKRFKREEAMHAVALEEAKVKLHLAKKQLGEGKPL